MILNARRGEMERNKINYSGEEEEKRCEDGISKWEEFHDDDEEEEQPGVENYHNEMYVTDRNIFAPLSKKKKREKEDNNLEELKNKKQKRKVDNALDMLDDNDHNTPASGVSKSTNSFSQFSTTNLSLNSEYEHKKNVSSPPQSPSLPSKKINQPISLTSKVYIISEEELNIKNNNVKSMWDDFVDEEEDESEEEEVDQKENEKSIYIHEKKNSPLQIISCSKIVHQYLSDDDLDIPL